MEGFSASVAKGSNEAILKAGDGKRGRNTRPTGGVQPQIRSDPHFLMFVYGSGSKPIVPL